MVSITKRANSIFENYFKMSNFEKQVNEQNLLKFGAENSFLNYIAAALLTCATFLGKTPITVQHTTTAAVGLCFAKPR